MYIEIITYVVNVISELELQEWLKCFKFLKNFRLGFNYFFKLLKMMMKGLKVTTIEITKEKKTAKVLSRKWNKKLLRR